MFRRLNESPDLYLDELRMELQETCGTSVSISTIWRTLVKGGYSMTKVNLTSRCRTDTHKVSQLTSTAIERSEEKRQDFAARIGTYNPSQLVFIDESAVDHRTTYCGRAWAIHGRKASRKAFFCCGLRYDTLLYYSLQCSTDWTPCRYSVLPALALEHGIIHCEIVEGAFDTDMFYTFISRLLDEMNPFPAPKSVIVMDNCQIHKHPAIVELIESR